jgi:hypothetical protein
LAGITTLHELVAEHLDPAAEPDQVLIGIETCGRCCGSITLLHLPGQHLGLRCYGAQHR